MTLVIGSRYKFHGYTEAEGYVDIVSLSEHNIFWAKLMRKGHPYNGKELPFSTEGKYIGSSRWQVPDLEREIPLEEGMESIDGLTNEVELEVELEPEPEEKELEL